MKLEQIAGVLDRLGASLLSGPDPLAAGALCWREVGRLRHGLERAGFGSMARLLKRIGTTLAYRSGSHEPMSEDELELLSAWFSFSAELTRRNTEPADWEMLLALISQLDPGAAFDDHESRELPGLICEEVAKAARASIHDSNGSPSIEVGALEGASSEDDPPGAPLLDPAPSDVLESTDVAGAHLAFGMSTIGDPHQQDVNLEAAEQPIWVGNDECELIVGVIDAQILPLLDTSADSGFDAPGSMVEEAGFQISLVSNALEHVGMGSLAGVLSRLNVGSESTGGPLGKVDALRALSLFLNSATPEDSRILRKSLERVVAIDHEESRLLDQELARVRLGADPASSLEMSREVSEVDLSLEMSEDALPNVIESMLRELPKNAVGLGAALRRAAEGEADMLVEACRIAHTLKGDANTVGVSGLANITHTLEEILLAAQVAPAGIGECLDVLMEAADAIEEIADFLCGRAAHPAGLLEIYLRLRSASQAETTDLSGDGSDPLAGEPPQPPVRATGSVKKEPNPAHEPVAAGGGEATDDRSLTVNVSLLDRLQRFAGETGVLFRRLEAKLDTLAHIRREMSAEGELERELLVRLDEMVALRGAALGSAASVDKREIDPLELDQYNELHAVSRRLLESVADRTAYLRRLESEFYELSDLRSQVVTTLTDLGMAAARTSSVPFSQIVPRLQRVARQAARSTSKQVELQVLGERTEIDTTVLEGLVEPLSHLLRNAVDHGIETASDRDHKGKSTSGRIEISVSVVGDRLSMRFADDGAGLDLDRLTRRGLALGLLSQTEDASRDRLLELIFAPGLTTRDEISQMSGRGMGMDIVRQRLQSLGGSIRVDSSGAQGLVFAISVPVSQAQANVVVIRGRGLAAGVVVSCIQSIVDFRWDDVLFDEQEGATILLEEKRCRIIAAEELFASGHQAIDVPGGLIRALIVSDGAGTRWAVAAASVEEARLALVKPVGFGFPTLPALRGITQLATGEMAGVIDLSLLLELRSRSGESVAGRNFVRQQQFPPVIVADDSLSVRKALQQLLEDAGFRVKTARDGLEVIGLVEQERPAALILDFEMPGMNGLEVAKHLRSRTNADRIPTMIVSSRSAVRYGNLVAESGVSVWLSKPFSDDEVVDAVGRLIDGSTS